MEEIEMAAFMHECRGLCLNKMPEAESILSVGSADTWYFKWFKNCYRYPVSRHVGIDIRPRPADLPSDIQWIQSDASNLSQIDADSVDLLFAGQFIEHLPWHKQADFLLEVHRVLTPGGTFVIDSLNFDVSNRYGWSKGGDHIGELSYPQIRDVLNTAGFEIADAYGILPTQLMGEPQRQYGKYLDNECGIRLHRESIREGVIGDPNKAFIWWIVCRKLPVNPDRENLYSQLRTYYLANDAAKLKIAHHQSGFIVESDGDYYIDMRSKESGFTLYGPYKTYPAGKYRVDFNLVLSENGAITPNVPIATLDVCTGLEGNTICRKDLTSKDMNAAASQSLEFKIDSPAILQFRVFSHGAAKFKTGLDPVLSSVHDFHIPSLSSNGTDEMDITDFMQVCRNSCLAKLPEAKTILHVGANASWYFEWFGNSYRYKSARQIGIDMLPRPANLPDKIQWIQSDASNLSQISTGSIDMVYAGQFIEHIPWEKQFNFLMEVHRVLAPGGTFSFDSPNFQITNLYGWKHPEHVSELSFQQIADLLSIAGFEIVDSQGIIPVSIMGKPPKRFGSYIDSGFNVQLYKHDLNRGLTSDPNRAFIWWIVCRKLQVNPDREKLYSQLRTYYLANEAEKLKVALHQVGFINESGGRHYIDMRSRESGFTLYGPYKTYPAAKYRVVFDLVMSEQRGINPNVPIATLDVCTGLEGITICRKDLTSKDMNAAASQSLEFRIDSPAVLQFRVLSHGVAKFKTGLDPVISQL